MKISIQEARTRLAKVGIELGNASRQQGQANKITHFRVTTPVGSQLELSAGEVIAIVRDLDSYAVAP